MIGMLLQGPVCSTRPSPGLPAMLFKLLRLMPYSVYRHLWGHYLHQCMSSVMTPASVMVTVMVTHACQILQTCSIIAQLLQVTRSQYCCSCYRCTNMIHDISFSAYSAAASHEADMVAAMQVMQQIKPHMMEYAAESIFMYTTYSRDGCRHAPYTPICASGPNGATLHYGHAASPNGAKPFGLLLL